MRSVQGNVTLVGTAHVSRKSVDEVRQTVQEVRPDVVCVELDEGRLKALRDPEAWHKVPIVQVLKEGRGPQLLAQVFLASYQRRIGEQTGVMPGAELLAAVQEAEDIGAKVVLADRDVGVTLRRAFAAMGFRERMRVSWELMKAFVGAGEIQEAEPKSAAESVDALLEKDALDEAMRELAAVAPSAKRVLIDERDAYLASRIAAAAKDATKVVAVVGAGHLAGIEGHLGRGAPTDLSELETVPTKKVSFWKIVGWGIPLAIVGLFAYLGYVGYASGEWRCFADAVLGYVLITGTSAAVGAALAGGHPISILVAFLAAPITVLHPALAAGWFAGAAEAWKRAPTVADFQGLSTLKGFSDMRKNRVVRVIMVAAVCNLTTTVGAAIVVVRILGVRC